MAASQNWSKGSAKRSFSEVFVDYARAFPEAKVVLVNHGPVGGIISDLPRDLQERCFSIEHLQAGNPDKKRSFHEAVLAYVGDPVVTIAEREAVLAIDVSGSMSRVFEKGDFARHFEEIVTAASIAKVALIDTSVKEIVPVAETLDKLKTVSGGSTALESPVRELTGLSDRVLVLTDRDGQKHLKLFVGEHDQIGPDLILVDIGPEVAVVARSGP